MAAGVAANHLARWDGSTWSPIGSGTDGPVLVVAPLPNGGFVCGGIFQTAGGTAAVNVALWDGAAWHALGNLANGWVSSVAVMPNGDIVAGGWFWRQAAPQLYCIARWNGVAWSPLGTGVDEEVNELVVLPNGDLVASGMFTAAGGQPANGLARFDGANWTAIPWPNNGSGYYLAMAKMPNGDLLVGSRISVANTLPAGSVWRWNGTAWAAVGPPSTVPASVSALHFRQDGTLILGGSFLAIGSRVSAAIAQLASTCPASAVTSGSACSSTVGPMVLSAETMPWTGSTMRTICTGIAPGSVSLGLFGFSSPGTSLAALHPAGGIGCTLLAAPDVVSLLLPVAGAVVTDLAIPNDPVFAGVVLAHQVLQGELGAGLSLSRLASSNGLTVSIGSF